MNVKIDQNEPISDIIGKIKESSKGKENIKLEYLFNSFESRSYAPLLFIPALLICSPLGAIPLAPIIIACILSIVSIQLTFGRRHPWIPKYIKEISISREKLISAFAKIEKQVSFIENYIKPRLKFLTGRKIHSLYGLNCLIISLSIIPLGLIPFAVMLPGFSICLMSIALLSKDGLIALISLFFSSAAIVLLISTIL